MIVYRDSWLLMVPLLTFCSFHSCPTLILFTPNRTDELRADVDPITQLFKPPFFQIRNPARKLMGCKQIKGVILLCVCPILGINVC